ncbi:OLC1v1013268C1 [Oldenlandia corymbosa var. corymbosa]|uniref:OLC1v1013268C1 n=1 Tax=Oldenlandia corymbosa var. corymbosa TaxID=529605 RepID=A0AAV1DXW8_OLDCO|nr:OLC1v1013268C1 [Oldenlandia corymbosa var. corymbosa]
MASPAHGTPLTVVETDGIVSLVVDLNPKDSVKATSPILETASFHVEDVDPSIVRSVDNVPRMIDFPLPIAALADILTMTAATLSLIAQLADTLLMTISTLGVMPMDQHARIALEMAESAEVAPLVVLPATVAVTTSHSTALLSDRSVETLLMMTVTLWTVTIAEVVTAFESELTMKSHELIEAGSLPMIGAELIPETVLAAGTVMA